MSIQGTTKRPKAPLSAPSAKPNHAERTQKAGKTQASKPADKADAPAVAKEVRAQGPKRAGSRQVAQNATTASQLERKIQKQAPDASAARTDQAPHADHGPHADLAKGGNGSAQVGQQFAKLTKDGNFSAKDARNLTAAVKKDGISEQEMASIEALDATKAAGKLKQKDTKRLSNTVTKLLAEYHAQPEVDRKDILKDLQAQNLNWTASGLADKLGLQLSEPRQYTLGPPVDTTNTSFDGRTNTPAKKYQMNIDNRNIDVIVEEPRTSGQYSESEIAKALSQVRPELLQHVNRVEVLNKPNGNASMQTNYSVEKGTVEVLPVTSERTVTQGAHILNHEIGHLQSRASLGYDEANWQAYADAISKDNRFPSKYAQTKPTEDFSEFLTLHEVFRNTPEEAAFRSLFPNRYAAAGNLLS